MLTAALGARYLEEGLRGADTRIVLGRATWTRPDGVTVTFRNDAFNWHHAGVRAQVTIQGRSR